MSAWDKDREPYEAPQAEDLGTEGETVATASGINGTDADDNVSTS